GESARTPGPQEGAGLGLSIARGIVEAHSGQIAVRNAGPGCQFLIRLPLARPGAPVLSRTGPQPATPSHRAVANCPAASLRFSPDSGIFDPHARIATETH